MKICRKCSISKPESEYNKRWPKVCRTCQNIIARAWYASSASQRAQRYPLRSIHSNMLRRCNNPADKKYMEYGGRGISVCARWTGKGGCENFATDMGARPSPKHSIDRINVNGNYEPSNCRWATIIQQQLNRRLFKTNTSGYRGVSWDRDSSKWRATIKVGPKKLHLGLFVNPVDAAIVFNAAAVQYRGSDAILNKIP